MSAVAEVAPAALRRQSWLAALRRGGPRLWIGLAIVLAFVLLALISLTLHDRTYAQDLVSRLQPPVWQSGGAGNHLLGTDSLGRDVLARIATAVRISLEIALAAVVIAGVTGVTIGVLAGYFGGWLDDVLMRVTDAVLATPVVLIALSVVAVIGGSLRNLIIVIAFVQWMTYARAARGETLQLRERQFVVAARSLGAGHVEIMRRHILPHLLPTVLVLATLNISTAILLEAGLSFLGLGVQPPDPSLGAMLTEGRQYIQRASWLAIYPGLVLLLVVLGVNLIGDGLRAVIDPTMRRRGR